MTQFQGYGWTIDLPPGWTGEQEEEFFLLFDEEDGIGALHVSGGEAEDEVTEKDLEAFAQEHLEAGARTRAVQAGDFEGFTLSYREDDEYWREWYLRAGKTYLFVTYNCDVEDQGVEDPAIEQVLDTLRTA